MNCKTVLKTIIGASTGLFLVTSTIAFAQNMGYQGNQHGPGMMGQPCQWNTTQQDTYGPMHKQRFHQNRQAMMRNQATPGAMRGPGPRQGTPCGMNPQCPAAQASTDTATP